MDIETAKEIFSMLDEKWYLNEGEQSLFDEAEILLEDNGLLDENGKLIDEDD